MSCLAMSDKLKKALEKAYRRWLKEKRELAKIEAKTLKRIGL